MTAKKAATSAKHKTATKKHAASAKHTETKAQLAHLHVLHVEHEAHLAHLKATGQKVTVKAKPAKPAKATKKAAFAIGDWLPVCGFEAVAMSLRLAGQFVHDDEVAGLWELAGADPLGASLRAALDTAGEHGLAGFRPRWKLVAAPVTADHLALPLAEDEAVSVDPFEDFLAGDFHGLILHVDVPGPHAVLATRDGWWSWGELYSPWRCNVLEAWAVAW